ncbi:hypothetical protein MN0502_15750 [Arthrobacter sp. MN05-02]|nr:hypothetical protein MN0502_15750 [Arthrobacter sp. MN05-02]
MAGDEIGRGEGLDHVGHGSGVTGALDEFLLAEGGQQDHRRDAGFDDLFRGGDAVHDGHLHVHEDEVRLVFLGEGHGLLAVVGLRDDLVPFPTQDLDDVESDERLVLGHDDPACGSGGRGFGGFRHCCSLVMWRSDGPGEGMLPFPETAYRHVEWIRAPAAKEVPVPPPRASANGPNGGIGRRAALKMQYREVCGFESHFGHSWGACRPARIGLATFSPADAVSTPFCAMPEGTWTSPDAEGRFHLGLAGQLTSRDGSRLDDRSRENGLLLHEGTGAEFLVALVRPMMEPLTGVTDEFLLRAASNVQV